jgi:hypothetical protein
MPNSSSLLLVLLGLHYFSELVGAQGTPCTNKVQCSCSCTTGDPTVPNPTVNQLVGFVNTCADCTVAVCNNAGTCSGILGSPTCYDQNCPSRSASCWDCITQPGCGYCQYTNQCLQGTLSGGPNSYCSTMCSGFAASTYWYYWGRRSCSGPNNSPTYSPTSSPTYAPTSSPTRATPPTDNFSKRNVLF